MADSLDYINTALNAVLELSKRGEDKSARRENFQQQKELIDYRENKARQNDALDYTRKIANLNLENANTDLQK